MMRQVHAVDDLVFCSCGKEFERSESVPVAPTENPDSGSWG
jgi:hypothetical protein